MYGVIPAERLNNLRYSLCVMEEQAHMGLDDEAADKLKSILVRRIERIEKEKELVIVSRSDQFRLIL